MKLKKLIIITTAGIVVMASNQAYAIDSLPGVDLWLPKSYQTHYLKLVEAAKKIQREPECWQLLNGRLNEGKSTLDDPIFYFRCRDNNRKSFSYEVDMKTMDIFSAHLERQRLLAKKEAKKQAEIDAKLEAEALDAKKKQENTYWKLCRKAIEQKISSFNDAKIITQEQPQGRSVDDETIQFKVDVDSLSLMNKVLRYSARCNISDPDTIDVKLKRRNQ